MVSCQIVNSSPILYPSYSAAQALPSPDHTVDEPTATTTATHHGVVDHPILKSFTITTKRNKQYNQINELLHTVHVMRFGNPESRESWWDRREEEGGRQQEGQEQQEDVQMGDYLSPSEASTAYESVNATLRQAFLQRHNHGHG
ncbi:hypothetical protein BDB00DRAFT_526800 [Zychaea mexicana]|uniref:uncharacterized protein n=1 Tax=Zychaea mexicana TaxID=64656 RepID=UPI0022FE5770|nr:uncharacterized protein BDB00DRAFT_526800 [Zychaea mexicana]KAI9490929.1 hypothetical protein BDB00DRAFT_526800 [Zychaea mexicana]